MVGIVTLFWILGAGETEEDQSLIFGLLPPLDDACDYESTSMPSWRSPSGNEPKGFTFEERC